jgi:hypothetical protein
LCKALNDRKKIFEEFILKGTINNTDPFLRVGFFQNFELPYHINPISLENLQGYSPLSNLRSNILRQATYPESSLINYMHFTGAMKCGR